MSLRLAFILIVCGFAAGAARAQSSSAGMTTVIGERFPLSNLCYEHARDNVAGEEGLAPCNQSLETELLSERRRAIVYANRGVINFNSGDYEAAVLDFTASLELGVFLPARLHVNRGLAYEILRYDALARADYRAALAVSPGNETAKRRLAELEKPFYERSKLPRRITAEAETGDDDDS